MRKLNKKGVALILSYLVLTSMIILTAGFALSTASELNQAGRYRDSAAAFWLAEAGINRFMQNTALLDGGDVTDTLGLGTLTLAKTDTAAARTVTVTATVNNITRELEIEFPPLPPSLFTNTLTSGGGLSLSGFLAKLDIFGATRLAGAYTESGLATGWFEDKQEGIAVADTTLTYPDSDNSGTADEFNDFVTFYQDLSSTYPANEVVYIQSDATQVIFPNAALAGTKIIFVEGSSAGTGDVDIYFDASWQDDQNLTIISTGSVDYIQPLQTSADSKLNIVTWSGYNEASILLSTHSGVTYSHSTADFQSIFSLSTTTGNVVANEDITSNEVIAWKKIYYSDPLTGGIVPPGFEGLIGTSGSGYLSSPSPGTWTDKGDQ